MISVADAKQFLLQNTPAPQPCLLPLAEAAGLVLAEDLYSPMDMPPFAQSAMDGYALNFGSLKSEKTLVVSHTIQAGSPEVPWLQPGEAMRIFTGAPVPPGADTVVMQEKVAVEGRSIRILDQELKAGANVRPRASQTKKGEQVAGKGMRLNPGISGFLAGLGIDSLRVYAAPKTGIVVTGKELVKPGTPLTMGQVYESSAISLTAALGEGGIKPQMLSMVDDDPELIYSSIENGLESCELLLITGGVSVGDYDFVHAALQRAGVKTIFYKVMQKPGKPLFCGRRDHTLVFGLPGNPGSALSCFYQYVIPAIRQMKGMKPEPEAEIWLPLSHDYSKKAGLTHFMKGRAGGEDVTILHAQESYKLNAFVDSNCLVELEENKSDFYKGELVRVYLLSNFWL